MAYGDRASVQELGTKPARYKGMFLSYSRLSPAVGAVGPAGLLANNGAGIPSLENEFAD
jgi:hypothetical protein